MARKLLYLVQRLAPSPAPRSNTRFKMRFPRELSAVLVTGALMASPMSASSAEPPSQVAPASEVAPGSVPAAEPAPPAEPAAPSDAEQYAAREATDGTAATFEGGDSRVYISGGAITLVLIVVILVILL